MPNSRTPKNTFRPAGSTWKFAPGLKIVFVEAVRSAAPPNSSGTVGNRVHHHLAGIARGHWLARREARNRRLPPGLQLALLRPLKLRRQLGIRRLVALEEHIPISLQPGPAIHRLAPVLQRRIRHVKALVLGEPEKLLGRRQYPPRPAPRRAPCSFPPWGCRTQSPSAPQ